jgi:hypothetical protein
VKLAAFAAATLSLSLFFEGFRQVSHEPSIPHLALLLLGIVFTALMVWLQAFWIYIEEKSKGSLAKKVVHFDKLEGMFLGHAASLESEQKEEDGSSG